MFRDGGGAKSFISTNGVHTIAHDITAANSDCVFKHENVNFILKSHRARCIGWYLKHYKYIGQLDNDNHFLNFNR